MQASPDRPIRIAIIGERQTSSAIEGTAETIGREIATRGGILICGAEAVIAIGGGYGTLSELGHALKIALPVIGVETWEVSRTGLSPAPIRRTRDPREAVTWAWRGDGATGRHRAHLDMTPGPQMTSGPGASVPQADGLALAHPHDGRL